MSVSLPLLLAVLAFTLIGCGKKVAPPAQPTAATETNATAAATQPLDGKVDPFLTQQLHIFMQQKGRFPTDFAELVRTRVDSRPRTPPGMKWVIDTATAEVKLVKQ